MAAAKLEVRLLAVVIKAPKSLCVLLFPIRLGHVDLRNNYLAVVVSRLVLSRLRFSFMVLRRASTGLSPCLSG